MNNIDLYQQIRPLLEVEQYRERYRYTNMAEMLAPNYGIMLPRYTFKGAPYVYATADAPIDIAPYYNTIADNADPATALNNAYNPTPIVIYVPKGEKAKQPIRIENTLAGDIDTMIIRRVLIIMEPNSEATVLFVDHATGQRMYLTSQVIEVFCADGAHLDMYDMEETTLNCRRLNNLYIAAGRNAEVRHNAITLSNGTSRNAIDVMLNGEGADVTLNGAVIADRQQHVDNNTLVTHAVPGCTSRELYKYVIDDQAVGAFAGRILVNEGAQQTASQMTNNNMCASNEARMYTQPMLEIYADDVKCAHGSTVGVMDEAALFYMQQRGIDLETARTLLKNAFIAQVMDEMKWESFRDRLTILIDKRLSKEERCGTCKICK